MMTSANIESKSGSGLLTLCSLLAFVVLSVGAPARAQTVTTVGPTTTPDPVFPSDATFKVVAGLADKTWVSLESMNFPGYYLHLRGSEFWLDTKATDPQYQKDATFKIVVVK